VKIDATLAKRLQFLARIARREQALFDNDGLDLHYEI